MDKKCFALLLFSLMGWLLQAQNQPFIVKTDTFFVNLSDIQSSNGDFSLKRSTKYDDYYFCHFTQQATNAYGKNGEFLLAFSLDGKEIRPVPIPEKAKGDFYFDLFSWQNTLYWKHHGNQYYQFNLTQWNWEAINDIPDIIYEDSTYCVFHKNFGEWGRFSWFVEKSPQWKVTSNNGLLQHNLDPNQYGQCRALSRILSNEDCYLFVFPTQVEQTPKTYVGSKCLPECNYQNVSRSSCKEIRYDCSFKADTIYHCQSHPTEKYHSEWRGFVDYDTTICGAFKTNGQIYYLVNTPNTTLISKLQRQRMECVMDLGIKCNFIKMYNSFRGRNIADNREFLHFSVDSQTYGIIDIVDNVVRIHFLVPNQD